MRGLPLNGNLTAAGARFVGEARTAPIYRLWSIRDEYPAMLRVRAGGAAIALEVWEVEPAGLVQILLQEPPGLCLGQIFLDDGRLVTGVLAEAYLVEGAREITPFGGWRAYLAAAGQANP